MHEHTPHHSYGRCNLSIPLELYVARLLLLYPLSSVLLLYHIFNYFYSFPFKLAPGQYFSSNCCSSIKNSSRRSSSFAISTLPVCSSHPVITFSDNSSVN